MEKRSLYKSMPDKNNTNRRRMFGEKIAHIIHRYTYRAQVPAKRSCGIEESESAGKEKFRDSGVVKCRQREVLV